MAFVEIDNEYSLQQLIKRCHNIIWERNGHDPAQSFDEFSKFLFLKLYDEREHQPQSRLKPRDDTAPAEFGSAVRQYFRQAILSRGYDGIFPVPANGSDPLLYVDDLTILEVLNLLNGFSLLQTTEAIRGADVKGTVYEKMVGSTFRGELGQFFTHRNLIDFMVRLVGVHESQAVYDPACGSGGFLIMAAKLIREKLEKQLPGARQNPGVVDARLRDYSSHYLLGTEINERTARVARLNLLMHGLDHSGIYNLNALKVDELGSPEAKSRLREGTIDLIFANPPFAGYEKDPRVLSRFELSKNRNGSAASVTREVLFMELIMRLLKDGGVAGIVIPQGILTDKKLQRTRDFIKENARILAAIELPDWAFIPSGTSVRGSLLFLRRTLTPPKDYTVFMKRINHIGFTSTGRPSHLNDLPETIAEYHAHDRRYLVPVNALRDRLDAKFYLPENRRVLKLFSKNSKHRTVTLEQIGSFEVDRYNPRAAPDREILLIETSDVDPLRLAINPKKIKGGHSHYTSLKIVRAGDLLISRRRAYRGAIVEVPLEYDGAMVIPEFSVLRLREGIDLDYVLEILRSRLFLELMTVFSTGEMSGRIGERDLRRLKIPMPEDQASLGREFARRRRRIGALETKIEAERGSIEDLTERIVTGI